MRGEGEHDTKAKSVNVSVNSGINKGWEWGGGGSEAENMTGRMRPTMGVTAKLRAQVKVNNESGNEREGKHKSSKASKAVRVRGTSSVRSCVRNNNES